MRPGPRALSGLPPILPVPAELRSGRGRFPLSAETAFTIDGEPRVQAALQRMLRRWEARTGLVLGRGHKPGVQLRAHATAAEFPSLGDDESYRLTVSSREVRLEAQTTWGVLRGLATLEQCLHAGPRGWFLPALAIADRPRFPWRGVLIDVCRHWQPLESLKRQLEAMALAKLNVLHLHLTEDQGFRIESRLYPRLHELGSDGDYFRQEEIRELVRFAADRGIRVVPEFDVPGHATSWLVGHPELGSAPGPYAIRRHWGVAEAALDPTNEQVYVLLAGFLGEMAEIFPDTCVHIGGDEVKAAHWSGNERIQRFIRQHNLGDNRGLQAYFNQRVSEILGRLGRHMVGWDEVLHPRLSAGTLVQSWRGVAGLDEATKMGCAALLSNGYYLDLWWPAARHYEVDPVPAGTTLTPDQQKLILGGEAAMWTEWTSAERLDGALWPRAAAVAERLWSPREVRDVGRLYARLPGFSARLEDLGLLHEKNRDAMLRRFAGDTAGASTVAALQTVAALFEPVKNYGRNLAQADANQFQPLTGFADFLRVESDEARGFGAAVETLLHDRPKVADIERLIGKMTAWRTAAKALPALLTASGRSHEIIPAAKVLGQACDIGLRALDLLLTRHTGTRAWRQRNLATIDQICRPLGHVELPLERPLKLLVTAASLPRPSGVKARAAWATELLAAARIQVQAAAPVYEQWL